MTLLDKSCMLVCLVFFYLLDSQVNLSLDNISWSLNFILNGFELVNRRLWHLVDRAHVHVWAQLRCHRLAVGVEHWAGSPDSAFFLLLKGISLNHLRLHLHFWNKAVQRCDGLFHLSANLLIDVLISDNHTEVLWVLSHVFLHQLGARLYTLMFFDRQRIQVLLAVTRATHFFGSLLTAFILLHRFYTRIAVLVDQFINR